MEKMNTSNYITVVKLRKIIRTGIALNFCSETRASNVPKKTPIIAEKYIKRTHTNQLNKYFKSEDHLAKNKEFIPQKCFQLRKSTAIEHLYLNDPGVAKLITALILPHIDKTRVCETNAGLGLITSELLDNNVNIVRIYESCPEFRLGLKAFNRLYPGRVELFMKDFFHIDKMSYMDQFDRGNRVRQMAKGVSKRNWADDPVLTVIGALPKMAFICYLIRILALQKDLVTIGRIQLFCFMRPAHYIKLTAGPHLNLHTYQSWSVLFNLFFEISFLCKVPRKCFLPWEQKLIIRPDTRYFDKIDRDSLYFVRINFKKDLPVATRHLLPLYHFVKQFFGKGTTKIIPAIEKLIPGLGAKFITMKIENLPPIGIYTTIGTLTPDQILFLFKEMVKYKGYSKSSFNALLEVELMKSETVESDQDLLDYNSDILHDLEDKIN